MTNVKNLQRIVSTFNLEKLAKDTNFSMRNCGKIDASNFILSFYKMLIGRCFSLRVWSSILSTIIGETVTFQAISKKITFRHVDFAKQLLHKSLVHSICDTSNLDSSLPFTKILIEDSTCIKLTDQLFETFPGSSHYAKPTNAICRVQLRIDILSNQYDNIFLQSFRDHDANYADEVLDSIQPNNLLIRDLGYYKFDVFQEINSKKAFFITRYKPQTLVYDLSNKRIDLFSYLRKKDINGFTTVDTTITMGENNTKVRLICFKLTKEQTATRLRKAKQNGNRNKNLSKKTKYLYSWNILITNIEKDVCSAESVYKLYRLRWSIELIFKQWKSGFRINNILRSAQGKNYIKPEMLLYLSLSFYTLILIPQFNKYKKLIIQKRNKHLSFYKFTSTFVHIIEFLLGQKEEPIIEILLKNCCYDKRKDQEHLPKILILKKLG